MYYGFNLINCTPHAITIRTTEGDVVVAPSGMVPRVSSSTEIAYEGFVRTTYGAIEGLPEPQEGTKFIVSAMILAAAPADRNDLVAPNTNAAIRNDQGHIVAVPNLIVK